MKSKTTTVNTESGVRILKSANCPSLSGKTKLQYQIGHDEQSGVAFRKRRDIEAHGNTVVNDRHGSRR